jgi:cellulose synthase/poly-beta-1,6-N-acetylglucosamine synthase-like glycosyltransferase
LLSRKIFDKLAVNSQKKMIETGYIIDTILAVTLLSLLIQLFYYFWFYGALAFVRAPRKTEKKDVPVSVIICARDEEENLKKFLPEILTQEYPEYEVVVVNDASVDGTEELLEKMSESYPRLRYTTIKKDESFTHAKKLAVLVGIKAARHEWLLFTDADCRPASPQWLSLMARNFTKKTSIVLGYGKYMPGKSLLTNFVRYEAFFIALQYFGFALRGIPYMGVGRNLAYRKPLFYEISRRPCFNKVVSGDDDLLVNRLGTKENTRTETDPRAHTLSVPPDSWKSWFLAKKRHITTSKYYTAKTKWLAAPEMISRILFLASVITLFFLDVPLWLPAGALLLRLSTQILIFAYAGKRLSEKQLLLSSLLYDMVIPFLYFAIWISNLSRTAERNWA